MIILYPAINTISLGNYDKFFVNLRVMTLNNDRFFRCFSHFVLCLSIFPDNSHCTNFCYIFWFTTPVISLAGRKGLRKNFLRPFAL